MIEGDTPELLEDDELDEEDELLELDEDELELEDDEELLADVVTLALADLAETLPAAS